MSLLKVPKNIIIRSCLNYAILFHLLWLTDFLYDAVRDVHGLIVHYDDVERVYVLLQVLLNL